MVRADTRLAASSRADVVAGIPRRFYHLEIRATVGTYEHPATEQIAPKRPLRHAAVTTSEAGVVAGFLVESDAVTPVGQIRIDNPQVLAMDLRPSACVLLDLAALLALALLPQLTTVRVGHTAEDDLAAIERPLQHGAHRGH